MPYLETAESKMTSRLVGSQSSDYRFRRERCQSLPRLLPRNPLMGGYVRTIEKGAPRLFIQNTFELY
jgi:hypothetical protein